MAEYIYNEFDPKDERNAGANPPEEPDVQNGAPETETPDPTAAAPAAGAMHTNTENEHPEVPASSSPSDAEPRPFQPDGTGPNFPHGAYPPPHASAHGAHRMPPPKKKRGRFVLAAVLVVLCICVSVGGGFAGAYLANRFFPEQTGTAGTQLPDAVLYREVSTTVTGSGEGGAVTVADVVSTVKDSVVEITTEFLTMSNYFQYVSSGAGSGVIISEDGYVVTNHHVIAGDDGTSTADKITVRLANGEEYEAELVGSDYVSDIAVLKIKASDLTAAIMGDSDKLVEGQTVIAIGNPLGELGGTVTDGIISALDREIDVEDATMNLLQTNAAVNPGNSGGGLFDLNGSLIGIVNAKSSGTGIEGLGFAIPINDAADVIEQLLEYGYVRGRVSLYITTVQIDDLWTAQRYGLSSTGLYVYSTEEGYNDDVLQTYDRIVAVDGEEIGTNSDVRRILNRHEVGDEISMTIVRKNRYVEVTVKCFETIPSKDDPVNFK